MRRVTAGILFPALLTAIVSGCGASEDPNSREVFPTFGLVTYKGKPIPDATVRLHPVNPPADGKPVYSSRGRVDETGFFAISTYRSGDGAPPGDYRVSISWLGPLKGVSEDEEDKLKERLPHKYTLADASGIQVTIMEGDNILREIALN